MSLKSQSIQTQLKFLFMLHCTEVTDRLWSGRNTEKKKLIEANRPVELETQVAAILSHIKDPLSPSSYFKKLKCQSKNDSLC